MKIGRIEAGSGATTRRMHVRHTVEGAGPTTSTASSAFDSIRASDDAVVACSPK